MNAEIVEADFANADHGEAIVDMLNAYASDPIGGGVPLPAEVRGRLVEGLRDHPTALVLLAYRDDVAIGIAVCFLGFSTFQAAPLLNIHDLAVVADARGRGVGRALLREAQRRAIERGCCRLTLEVQDENERALRVYRRFGFREFVVGEAPSPTRFLSKPLLADGSGGGGAQSGRDGTIGAGETDQ